jgi:predicted nucleotidyltransferase/DNA-binding HxlR family transcriptional regulator
MSIIIDIMLTTSHNESMRLHDPLDDILGSKTKVRILRLLFRTRGLFSGREVSRLIGFSPTHTISNLRQLEALGLVLKQHAGNTDLYQLDSRNSAVDGVLAPIFSWESGLLDELAQMFVDRLGSELVSLRLFGSVARGDEEPSSDVDLLIVLTDSSDPDKMEDLITEVDLDAGRRLGSPVSTIQVTESEYARKVKGRRGFWKDIPRESKVIYQRDELE